MNGPLAADELHKMNAYWRAANYVAVGQIYLFDNPLLKNWDILCRTLRGSPGQPRSS
jgi:phosphoketolase